ncbi:hypothetical protein SFRURICE_017621 [Spodoptera frugiperda]|nr:hypothetical protein SFRURICE_017621 [Spodoptera frugiperda]
MGEGDGDRMTVLICSVKVGFNHVGVTTLGNSERGDRGWRAFCPTVVRWDFLSVLIRMQTSYVRCRIFMTSSVDLLVDSLCATSVICHLSRGRYKQLTYQKLPVLPIYFVAGSKTVIHFPGTRRTSAPVSVVSRILLYRLPDEFVEGLSQLKKNDAFPTKMCYATLLCCNHILWYTLLSTGGKELN